MEKTLLKGSFLLLSKKVEKHLIFDVNFFYINLLSVINLDI